MITSLMATIVEAFFFYPNNWAHYFWTEKKIKKEERVSPNYKDSNYIGNSPLPK